MKTRLYLIVIGLAGVASCQEPAVPPVPVDALSGNSNHPKHTEYTGLLTDYQRQTRAPGAVMLVAKATQPSWTGAVGRADLDNNTPFTTETPFRIGSITKVFVGTLMLKLVDKGKLRLDSKLAQLLPEIAAQIPQSDEITVRQLLAHSSGVIDPPNQSLQYQADIVNAPVAMQRLSARARVMKYVARKPLLFEPGSNYAYSNAGYWLLELIAESLTDQPLPQLMATELLTPLGLTKTYVDDNTRNDTEQNRPARGYTVTTPGKIRDVSGWDKAEGNGNAAGGMVSTAGDLHQFYTALFGGQILSPTLLADMQRQQLAGCTGIDCEYGLGLEIWHVDGQTGYGHNGALIGIEANALYFPASQTTIILYKNLGGGSDKSFFEKLVQ